MHDAKKSYIGVVDSAKECGKTAQISRETVLFMLKPVRYTAFLLLNRTRAGKGRTVGAIFHNPSEEVK